MTRKKSLKKRNDTNNYRSTNNETSTKSTRSGSGGTGNIKGLINLGNTCYFNSMLQMILNSPHFMQDLKAYCSADYEMDVGTPNGAAKLVLKHSDVSSVEKELLKIWESVGGTCSPAGLRNALLKNDQFRAHFNGFNEQDSHEAFLVTLNIVRDAQVRRIRKAVLDHFQWDRHSSSIPSGADSDSGAGGTSSSPVSEDTRNAIRAMGALADRHSLVQARFGLVVASALRCYSCGTLRLRFDDCLHLSPALEALDRDAGPSTSRDSPQSGRAAATPAPAPAAQQRPDEAGQNRKMSKHQLKKQKRIERKTKRTRKASVRNSECSPGLEDVPTSDNADGDTNRVETDSAYDTLSADIEPQHAMAGDQCLLGKDSRTAPLPSAVGNDDMSIINETALRFAAAVSLDSGCVESIDEDQTQQDLCPEAIALDDGVSNDNDGSTITHGVNESPIPANSDQSNDENSQTDENGDGTEPHNEYTATPNCDVSMVTTNIDDVTTHSNELPVITGDSEGSRPTGDVTDTGSLVKTSENGHCGPEDKEMGGRVSCSWSTEAERPRDARAMQEVFQGVLETHAERCLIGQYEEPAPVPVHPQTDLERALDQFVAPMALDGLVCDSCSRGTGALRPHEKVDRVCHAPAVLPIYISRFKQAGRKGGAKNSQHYTFPFVLDLSGQCSALANVPGGARPVLYRLHGIIEHIGARVNSGHYISYVSEPRQSDCAAPGGPVQGARRSADWTETMCRRFAAQQEAVCDEDPAPERSEDRPASCVASDYNWFRISDSHVEPVSPAAVLGCQAFMLFYWRIQ